MMTRKLKLIAVVLFIFVTVYTSISFLSSNIPFLLRVAGGTDVPSNLHYWAKQQIYKQCRNPSTRMALVRDFASGRNKDLTRTYIEILGVVGDTDAWSPIVSKLLESVNNRQYFTIIDAIDSLGLIDSVESIAYLKTCCDHYSQHHLEIPPSLISRAIFLITGDNYSCQGTDKSGTSPKLAIDDELIGVREIIVASRGRYRTLDEMITLDKLLRPPNWK